MAYKNALYQGKLHAETCTVGKSGFKMCILGEVQTKILTNFHEDF